MRRLLQAGQLQERYQVVPLKKLPVRVAKYDVRLREGSLRAVQAMHAILSRMVLFHCKECKERFPTFHPAYVPPPTVANEMEILKRGKTGVAACTVEVHRWDELPPLEAPDGVATCCAGICVRCQKDMDDCLKDQGGDPETAVIVALRSEDNHMDPCFRFPIDDLRDLFEGATLVESMLVALEHMQVNFVTVSWSGLRKFRRNTISFPQDIGTFAARHGMMKQYRPGDRVNSSLGPGRDIEREARKAVTAAPDERERFAVDACGFLIFPATVREVLPDGTLVLDYDHGGEGLELHTSVRPRQVMPWHPKDVPLHLMLRRNVGRGRDPLEGLQVRWGYVSRLLQALCAFPRNGYGPWRLGGSEEEPMHKYYDARLFDVMSEVDMKSQYAPKVSEGVVLGDAAAAALDQQQLVDKAVDVTEPEHFIAAGFDVNFVGPEGDLHLGEGAAAAERAEGKEEMYVEVETFCRWLDLSELRIASSVALWWTMEETGEEGAVDCVKYGDDETTVDLFARIRSEVGRMREEQGEKADGVVRLSDLVVWLQLRLGAWLALDDGVGSEEVLADQVLHELTIVSSFRGAESDDRGCMQEPVEKRDEEEEAVRIAERLVYGWPSRDTEATGANSRGRFVKAHPLDFPMGVADLNEERPRTVSPEVWVQHMLRYWTGHFVGGLRGQRVVWSMVNALLLSEARSHGWGVYRNVMRRVGLGLEGGRVLTKARLKQILGDENRARVLVGQLSNVGRQVRSTPMQWAFEGKKLDATVKHLSTIPPWVQTTGERDEPPGRRYLGEHTWGDVEDRVGQGRHPSVWWTLNCKYNAAYDVQRMNVKSTRASEALDVSSDGYKEERFLFARDNPDLVAYMLALRTELHMRMVMPAVVPHSGQERYMAMARFETGSNGNPHWHGFSMGKRGPRMCRVRADVDGDGDEAPDTLSEDLRVAVKVMEEFDEECVVLERDLRDRLRSALARDAGEEVYGDMDDKAEELESVPGGGAEGSDANAEPAPGDGWSARVTDVLRELVARGVAEVLFEGQDECGYRRVAAVVRPRSEQVAATARCGRRGRPDGVGAGQGLAQMIASPAAADVFHERNRDVRLQSDLESSFAEFFGGMVSEWNPCYADNGQWRYRWDEEIGAHDVEMDMDVDASSATAEEKALHDVEARWPERLNLRALLDKIFASTDGDAEEVDLQRVRRMVAALVQRVERHTRHGVDKPTLNVHACARGKESCPVCRYGFPHDRLERGGARGMVLDKGDREGQWHARFPRNDRLCCSYEEHVLLANMGNVDWRPCLNLWAVVQYVTKYATKAPKGSRKLNDVLKDAVDEVCKYVPEGEGNDFLRRSIQKFFARTLGERDFHAYEALQLGLQLPLVLPLMPVVSLNTSGARPLKSWSLLKDASPDAPVHQDSRVDKFNKRLQIVRNQFKDDPALMRRWEKEVRDVSLYEFWWKYDLFRGTLRRVGRAVCLMVTPSYSADCANVAHACHESYARVAVIAYWRHMSTKKRHEMIENAMSTGVKAIDRVYWGASKFEPEPDHAAAPELDRHLGVRDLYDRFEGRGDVGWGMALMEMLTDPMLLTWVPDWVVEQYERANPFFRDALRSMETRGLSSNRTLLLRTKREMIRRHERSLKKAQRTDVKETSSEEERDADGASECGGDVDADVEGDKLAAALAEDGGDEDGERVEIERDPRPVPGCADGARGEDDADWARASPEERLSAAGAAAQAGDRLLGAPVGESSAYSGADRHSGVLLNPRNYPWTTEPCNVPHSEHARLLKLNQEWCGKVSVGDGAARVERDALDPWQKFVYDIVMNTDRRAGQPLRLMLMGTAGTGKSRTVRAFVSARRDRCRAEYSERFRKLRADLAASAETKMRKLQAELEKDLRNVGAMPAPAELHADGPASAASKIEKLLACIEKELRKVRAGPAAAASGSLRDAFAIARLSRLQTDHAERLRDVRSNLEAEAAAKLKKVQKELDEKLAHVCQLAAPTGCASFQLKFGASTLHRIFGIGIGYCGPWASRTNDRYQNIKARLTQACLFVMDEMSMVGRQMLGKIEFKVRDTLGNSPGPRGEDVYLGGKDVVLAGDPKQANPIGDDPLHKEGEYTGRGMNKPRGSDSIPAGAWSTKKLVRMGMNVRNGFDDVVLLRQVHRYVDEDDTLSPERKEEYRKDAEEFLKVTRGMADCTWTVSQHAWLSRRNRSVLQQTAEGREELRKFQHAPILMDGRQDRANGDIGAIRLNKLRLEQEAARTGKPIASLGALHDKPKVKEGEAPCRPETMHAEDFKGLEAELLMCEGARVLLTQNVWVEAGLMNGALGYFRGYMWPEHGDPHSTESNLRSPLCVFVEFDSINLGNDSSGRPRSFFPDDPPADVPGSRRNWVPIFRQRVSSNVEEHVAREQYPLTLAWALTHWKAQGMTLDRVRVHLSDRTAGMPGIGFVATTRVKHPWDLVFEEDLPEYEHFMKARKTPAFRSRRRFELRQEARASRTLRRYGFCEADLWSAEEREAASAMLSGLMLTAKERRNGLRDSGRPVDADAWLWPEAEPDFEGELARQAVVLAGADVARRGLYEWVAQRLLDRVRARVATEAELAAGAELLRRARERLGDAAGRPSLEALEAQAMDVAGADVEQLEWYRGVARSVHQRLALCGEWDGVVGEPLALELQPLHMPAVREALGALIPERLHASLDKATQRGKDNFGVVRGGSFLKMDGWQINVRNEDALSQGRLHEETLEFFLKVLERVCAALKLPVVIGSKTVGKEAGRAPCPAAFARVMERWRKVWQASEVAGKPELLLPVAVDDKPMPQDWVLVSVRSCVAGERLGDATRLHVQVHDAACRVSVAERVARNLDVLVRGVAARVDGDTPRVERVACPDCRVSSQRILCALGLLLGRVATLGEEVTLDMRTESFIPDLSHALRAVFAFFRKELCERAVQDVSGLLRSEEQCRKVLRMCGTVPSLVSCGGGSAFRMDGAIGLGSAVRGAPVTAQTVRVLRVATWNVAGGHRSAQSPSSWSAKDQKAAVLAEVLRWDGACGCDVVALQECESDVGHEELLGAYVFVGSAAALANRGYVHLYVRRGLNYEAVPVGGARPCVAARLEWTGGSDGEKLDVVVASVHLPTGDRAGARSDVVQACLSTVEGDGKRVLVVGDVNAKDEEVESLCRSHQLRDARYCGFSWGVKGNGFYADSAYRGPGLRCDRVLFGEGAWAESHLIAQGKVFFEGREFYLSDHFGLMAYVDFNDVYAAGGRSSQIMARARRGHLVAMKDVALQKELVEAKAQLQLGREAQALARQRAAQRDRGDFQKAQQRAARQRTQRRAGMRCAAFGPDSLFAEGVSATCALSGQVPCAPREVAIPVLRAVSRGDWGSTCNLPLRGLRRMVNTCYVNSASQVLMRIPAVFEWMEEHAKQCPGHPSCVVCSLRGTSAQVLAGGCRHEHPVIAQRREQISETFAGDGQHDVFEFVENFFAKARKLEIEAGRYGLYGHVQIDRPVATHVDRIFGFVRETRRRCTVCLEPKVRTWFSHEYVWRVTPAFAEAGPLTVAELFLASCAPITEKLLCEDCDASTEHLSQSRILHAPNVLVIQVRRRPGVAREPVDIEEQLDVPGLPCMALEGVVYHCGFTVTSGHYTCLCRGPRGRYWYFDDSRPVVSMDKSVGDKPREVYMLVYCRLDGSAEWADTAGGGAQEVVVDLESRGLGSAGDGAEVRAGAAGVVDLAVRDVGLAVSPGTSDGECGGGGAGGVVASGDVGAPVADPLERERPGKEVSGGATRDCMPGSDAVGDDTARPNLAGVLVSTSGEDCVNDCGDGRLSSCDRGGAGGVIGTGACGLGDGAAPATAPPKRRRLLRKSSSAPASDGFSDACGGEVLAEKVRRRFTPASVDPLKCLARTREGRQCKNGRRSGDFCGWHQNAVLGRVDGPVPEAAMPHFLHRLSVSSVSVSGSGAFAEVPSVSSASVVDADCGPSEAPRGA